MLVWIKKSQNRATRVCLQKKGKEKSVSPSGVIFEAGLAEVGGLCIATERLPDLQKSILTKQVHHLQNRHRNQTRVHLIVFFFLLSSRLISKRKKNGCSSFELAKLAGNRKGWADLSQAMHLIDICARAQSWAIFVAKDFGLANKQAF